MPGLLPDYTLYPLSIHLLMDGRPIGLHIITALTPAQYKKHNRVVVFIQAHNSGTHTTTTKCFAMSIFFCLVPNSLKTHRNDFAKWCHHLSVIHWKPRLTTAPVDGWKSPLRVITRHRVFFWVRMDVFTGECSPKEICASGAEEKEMRMGTQKKNKTSNNTCKKNDEKKTTTVHIHIARTVGAEMSVTAPLRYEGKAAIMHTSVCDQSRQSLMGTRACAGRPCQSHVLLTMCQRRLTGLYVEDDLCHIVQDLWL